VTPAVNHKEVVVAIVTGENPKQYAVKVLYKMVADAPPQGEAVTCWNPPVVAGSFLCLTLTNGQGFRIPWELVQAVTWELV
jgi:hypothetical protein